MRQQRNSHFVTASQLLAAVCAAWALCGCGGGGSSNGLPSSTNTPPAVASHADVSPPTSISWIRVVPWCGKCLELTHPEVLIDGLPATVADVSEAEIVTLGETLNTSAPSREQRHIDRIEVTTLLQGPLEKIDLPRAQMIVMGQLVQFLITAIGDVARANPSALAGFQPGEMVRVSGFRSRSGKILATRIDHAGPDADIRILGRLEAGPEYLQIAGLNIDLSGATQEGLPGGAREGDVIFASGELADASTLLAKRISMFDPFANASAATRVSAQGLVESYSAYEFPPWSRLSLLDLTFQDTSCEYDSGFDADYDQLWSLEGSMVDGIVEVRCSLGNSPFDLPPADADAQEFAGPIQAIDIAAQTMTVRDKTVQLTFVTRLATPDPDWGFFYWFYNIVGLDALEVGQTATVNGRVGATEDIVLAHTIIVQ